MEYPARRYVIVGGGAAGMAAAQTIRRVDGQGAIIVLSEEGDAPYYRPLIPFLISGKKRADQIHLQGQGPYSSGAFPLRLNTRVVRIDPAGHQVTTADGDSLTYDRLLIATGSAPFIPPDIQGAETDGVFALRTLADARRVAQRVACSTHAVMLGGGLLNLKAAFALLERGLKVTLVVFSAEVLSQLMDPGDAGLIRSALNQAGLQILTGRSATAIVAGRNGVQGVTLDDGQELPCQMVCIGKGVQPNTACLKGSGIAVERGVMVDSHTAASQPDLYAAGDVAATFDPISGERTVTGLWTNAVEMGRCAGANMAGRPTDYGGTFGILNATQVARMPFVCMGRVHTAGSDCQVHAHTGTDTYRKLVFSLSGDRLIGAVFVGDITKAGLYRFVMRERMPVKRFKRHIIDHTLHYGHLLLSRN